MGIKITVEISGGVLDFVYASGDTPEEKHLAETIEVTILDHDAMEEKERLELQDFASDKQICIW
tara:strand:- start:53 stop:244 length:192 start_codon:yes stop_codon:yes gene_type:complete